MELGRVGRPAADLASLRQCHKGAEAEPCSRLCGHKVKTGEGPRHSQVAVTTTFLQPVTSDELGE